MNNTSNIKIIGFDADDTLWMNECYYRDAEKLFCEIVSEFVPSHEASNELFRTEISNLESYGYGIKAFTLSLLETALRISNHQISQKNIQSILDIAKTMIEKPVELLDGVEDVLQKLHDANYKLIVATKGDLLDQERKLEKSGIEQYFHHIEIMSDKQESNYKKLLNHLDINPEEFLMIGNSVKSDILPILNLGGNAIHVPFHTTWAHEQVNNSDIVNFPVVKSITETLDIILEQKN